MKTQPFLNNLWSRELVLEQYGPTAKVYPVDAIFAAFDISQARETLRLLTRHGDEIADAEDGVKLATKTFDNGIESIERDFGYDCSDGVFEVMHFLESTSMNIEKFQQEYHSDYLCWPVDDRDSLEGCFKEYHVYKFYEKYMHEISGGVELFLNLIPEVHEPIRKTQICDDFYWDRGDISFLYQYREAKIALMEKLNPPPIEA